MSANPLKDLIVEPLVRRVEPVATDEILVFAAMRNEELRLPAFLEHYRKLGVSRFFIVDNDSTDGTRSILTSAKDIVPFHTPESYGKAEAGRLWTDQLRDRFGRGVWCLTVDADELLCFPATEQLDLHDLTDYCDRHGYEGLFTFLLDMYPEGPLDAARYEAGNPLLDAFPLFDAEGYVGATAQRFPPFFIFGGVRRRGFLEQGEEKRFVALRKTPLIRWREGITYHYSTHSHSPIRLADVTGVLLHFKFMPGFGAFAAAESARGKRYDTATYERYARIIGGNGAFTLSNGASRRYRDSAQLVELGLMKSSLHFLNDVIPAFRQRLGLRAAEEFRLKHKAALEEAATRFRPDFRSVLQVWDAFSGLVT